MKDQKEKFIRTAETDFSEVSSNFWDSDYSARHTPVTVQHTFEDICLVLPRGHNQREKLEKPSTAGLLLLPNVYVHWLPPIANTMKNEFYFFGTENQNILKNQTQNTNESWFCFLYKKDKSLWYAIMYSVFMVWA